MSNPQEPRKPRRQKSKRLNLNVKKQWEALLKEIHKEQVPVNVLKYVTVNLKDGTSVDIDVESMLTEGVAPDFIEQLLNDKLEALDDYINDVDFHISVDSVAKVVQPFTDSILKNL
jgi:hypothetical protein